MEQKLCDWSMRIESNHNKCMSLKLRSTNNRGQNSHTHTKHLQKQHVMCIICELRMVQHEKIMDTQGKKRSQIQRQGSLSHGIVLPQTFLGFSCANHCMWFPQNVPIKPEDRVLESEWLTFQATKWYRFHDKAEVICDNRTKPTKLRSRSFKGWQYNKLKFKDQR